MASALNNEIAPKVMSIRMPGGMLASLEGTNCSELTRLAHEVVAGPRAQQETRGANRLHAMPAESVHTTAVRGVAA